MVTIVVENGLPVAMPVTVPVTNAAPARCVRGWLGDKVVDVNGKRSAEAGRKRENMGRASF